MVQLNPFLGDPNMATETFIDPALVARLCQVARDVGFAWGRCGLDKDNTPLAKVMRHVSEIQGRLLFLAQDKPDAGHAAEVMDRISAQLADAERLMNEYELSDGPR